MNSDQYVNNSHRIFGEGLERLVSEESNIKPTKSALAKFLGFDASYLKTDGSIEWHEDIINRCKIATDEFMRMKSLKDERKKQRNKSQIQKLKDELDDKQKEIEQLSEALNSSRAMELYLYQEWHKTQQELDNVKKNSMSSLAINNDWRK